jgi:hypothetical protein
MPYRIRWEGHGAYQRFFGVLSAQDILDAYEEMTTDLRHGGIRYIVSDYLEATAGPDLSERDVERFARLEKLQYYGSPDIVRANVATDEGILAFIRYFESLQLSPYPMGVFSNVAEARSWIAGSPRRGRSG